MEEKRYLTFALGKGRLAKKTLELFEKIGITCDEIRDPDTRKLIFVNEELGLRFFLAKGQDVPTYVEYGAADIGIVGKDTILEESRNIYEVLDLGFGKCRMCVCGYEEAKCASVDRKVLRNFCSIMNRSVWQPSIRGLPKIIFITKNIRRLRLSS